MKINKRRRSTDARPAALSSALPSYMDTGVRINQTSNEFGFFSTPEPYGRHLDPPQLPEKVQHSDPYRDIPIVVPKDKSTLDMAFRIKNLQIHHPMDKPLTEEYQRKTVNSVIEMDKEK